MQDQTIKCHSCDKNFVWTVAEQQMYQQRNFAPPVTCEPCREARKAPAQGR